MAYVQVTEAFAGGGGTRECVCIKSLKEWKGAHVARRGEEKRIDARGKEERRGTGHPDRLGAREVTVGLYTPMTLGHYNEAL